MAGAAAVDTVGPVSSSHPRDSRCPDLGLWNSFLERVAKTDGSLKPQAHRELANSASPAVRRAWARRGDLPSTLVLRQAAADPDPQVLAALATSPARSAETLSGLCASARFPVAAAAALNPRCPDDVAAATLAGKSHGSRSRLKDLLASVNLEEAGGRRPATASLLVTLTPLQVSTVGALWHLAVGTPDTEAILAGRLKGLAPGAKSTGHILEKLTTLAPPCGVLADALRCCAGRCPDPEQAAKLRRWLDTGSGGQAVTAALEAAALHDDPQVLGGLVDGVVAGSATKLLVRRLLLNPATPPAARARLLAVVDVGAVGAWAKTVTADVSVDEIRAGLRRLRNAGTASSVGQTVKQLIFALAADADRRRVAVELLPSVARAVAADSRCSPALALAVPDAEAALLAYHDPGRLYQMLAEHLDPAQLEVLGVLAQEFSGSLEELVTTVRLLG